MFMVVGKAGVSWDIGLFWFFPKNTEVSSRFLVKISFFL